MGQLETFTQDHSYLDRAGRHYRSRWLALLRVCEQPVYEAIHQFVFAGNPRGANTPGACWNRDLLHTPPSPLGFITPLRGKPDPDAPSALHVRHFLGQRNNRSGKDEEVRTRPELLTKCRFSRVRTLLCSHVLMKYISTLISSCTNSESHSSTCAYQLSRPALSEEQLAKG